MLSACSTGWRPSEAETLPLTGDDALGLVASFLEAGARFVLASIPPALDEAAFAFAVAWHRHRLGGASPLAAVRATQLELLKRADLPPWSWVGITGYGCR
ncbi:CHAT domain-containing protein [Couchioplanes caeruleus]|uniref:CHAT domain-containing protein n=1 Tax=Couchioplanes caeruleus TaxID=56438 RepID=UPI001474566B|nr:CHAT domain-containing protein [Couchioplanes caeruleus]